MRHREQVRHAVSAIVIGEIEVRHEALELEHHILGERAVAVVVVARGRVDEIGGAAIDRLTLQLGVGKGIVGEGGQSNERSDEPRQLSLLKSLRSPCQCL